MSDFFSLESYRNTVVFKYGFVYIYQITKSLARSQAVFTCSKLTIETIERVVNYVQRKQ